jgi:hypothetical protein
MRRREEVVRRRQEEERQEERFASMYMRHIPPAQMPVFQAADRDEYLRVVPQSRRRNTNPRTRRDYHPFTENM